MKEFVILDQIMEIIDFYDLPLIKYCSKVISGHYCPDSIAFVSHSTSSGAITHPSGWLIWSGTLLSKHHPSFINI